MVEAIVTSAQPPQFFFFFPMLFSSIRLVMSKEFRGNLPFFREYRKKEYFPEIPCTSQDGVIFSHRKEEKKLADD